MQARLEDPRLSAGEWRWLPSEASVRRFARLVAPAGCPAATAVLMVFPPGTPPAEVARVEAATRALAAGGVPVPAVHASDPGAGWILQEDLGDVTLAAALARGDDPRPLYAEALGLLPRVARLRLSTSPTPPLDARRMADELDLFLAAHLAPRLAAADLAPVRVELRDLAVRAARGRRHTCHRDYHARNLMVHGGRLRVVDHQDAMAGPACYDRVSLAYDPYVELPDALRDRLAGRAPGTAAVAVQRLCKALGTYATKGGRWAASSAPAARQARRLIAAARLPLPRLAAALDAAPGEAAA